MPCPTLGPDKLHSQIQPERPHRFGQRPHRFGRRDPTSPAPGIPQIRPERQQNFGQRSLQYPARGSLRNPGQTNQKSGRDEPQSRRPDESLTSIIRTRRHLAYIDCPGPRVGQGNTTLGCLFWPQGRASSHPTRSPLSRPHGRTRPILAKRHNSSPAERTSKSGGKNLKFWQPDEPQFRRPGTTNLARETQQIRPERRHKYGPRDTTNSVREASDSRP